MLFKKIVHSESGLTLMEVAMATGIAGFLGLVLLSTFQMQSKSVQTATAMTDMQALSALTQQAMRAPAGTTSGCFYALTAPFSPGSFNLNGSSLGTINNLTLQLSPGLRLAPNSTFGSMAINNITLSPAPGAGATPVRYQTGVASISGTTTINDQYNAVITITATKIGASPSPTYTQGQQQSVYGATQQNTVQIPITLVVNDSAPNSLISCNLPQGTTTDVANVLNICSGGTVSGVSLLCPSQFPTNSPPPCKSCLCQGGCGGGGGYGGGKGCFIAGTKVETPHGPVAIEKLAPGDPVYAYNAESGETVESVVDALLVHQNRLYGEVTLDDGTVLDVTPVHRFYLPLTGEWKAIGSLQVGDVLMSGMGGSSHPVRIRSLDFSDMKRGTVYNLTVRKYHNYYVHGVLVHNVKGMLD